MMSYYIDNPVMCTECGVRHGHHAVSCEQAWGDALWKEVETELDAILATVPPRERHRYTGKGRGPVGELYILRKYGPRGLEAFKAAAERWSERT